MLRNVDNSRVIHFTNIELVLGARDLSISSRGPIPRSGAELSASAGRRRKRTGPSSTSARRRRPRPSYAWSPWRLTYRERSRDGSPTLSFHNVMPFSSSTFYRPHSSLIRQQNLAPSFLLRPPLRKSATQFQFHDSFQFES